MFQRCVEIANSAPDELSVHLGIVHRRNGSPVVLVNPTWCGPLEPGEAHVAPFSRLGTLIMGAVEPMCFRAMLNAFDPFLVYGRRTFMETCWLPALDSPAIDVFIQAAETAVSPGCAVFTHEFKGAATRAKEDATAFGLRGQHVLVEIIAACTDRSDTDEEERHRQSARATRHALDAIAFPGGYPNLLSVDADPKRIARSHGRNARRLIEAKGRSHPDNVFHSAIPLPVVAATAAS